MPASETGAQAKARRRAAETPQQHANRKARDRARAGQQRRTKAQQRQLRVAIGWLAVTLSACSAAYAVRDLQASALVAGGLATHGVRKWLQSGRGGRGRGAAPRMKPRTFISHSVPTAIQTRSTIHTVAAVSCA